MRMVVSLKITEAEQLLRKNKIIHRAFELFCRDGIDKVSVKDVAEQAGVGEKSIYRYFNSKSELVLSTVAVLWKEIVSEMVGSIEAGYSEENGLGQIGYLLRSCRYLFEHCKPYVMFSYESRMYLARHDLKITEELYADELRPIEALFVSALEMGMQDGSIAFVGDVTDLYYAIWGTMRGYVVKIVIYDQMYAGENMWLGRFDMVCALLLNGLSHER